MAKSLTIGRKPIFGKNRNKAICSHCYQPRQWRRFEILTNCWIDGFRLFSGCQSVRPGTDVTIFLIFAEKFGAKNGVFGSKQG
jgi:hypothetical protein